MRAMDRIENALLHGTAVQIRGKNALTGERGTMYEVTEYGEVFYWGSRVAHVGKKACIVDLCGWPTPTTRQVINLALDVYSRRAGKPCPRVYQHRNEQWLGDSRWDGSKKTVR